jgi:cyclohexanone monooxygenase
MRTQYEQDQQTSVTSFDAIVIGAGVGGMYALHHLRDELGLRVRGFDGASDVGGTWWYNRYPGARVDAPSTPFYAYTFSAELAQEWSWSETQSTSAQVRTYLEHVADRFDLRRDIAFETWVDDAFFDERAQRWMVQTRDGTMYSARFLVCAVGALFVAHRPDYPGIDEFAGECYHTGRWPHHPVSFEGKRVGIMGTGSSGIQAIPEIAKTAEHVTVFQRTPQYALPARNRPMTDAERSAYQADWQDHRMSMRRRGGWPFATSKLRANEATAAERQARYEEMWALGGMNLMINSYVGAIVDADLNNEISDFVRGKIRQTVKDAATAEKLMPDYHIGTKRIILDNGYFETYNRDNVSLVDLRTDPIESFAAGCVSTQSQEIPLDMLVLATGYDAVSGSMLNLNPRGRSGIPLQQKWAERFDTHLGVSVAGFPNMFMIHGPGSPGVFFTMPLGAELQVQWVGQCIRHLDGNGHGTVETTPAAEQAWDAQIQAIANKTLYPKTNSWYLGANIPGKPRQFLGHLAGSQYFDQLTATAEADFAGFVFEPAADS